MREVQAKTKDDNRDKDIKKEKNESQIRRNNIKTIAMILNKNIVKSE